MKKLVFIFLMFNVLLLNAQFYSTGQDPASTRWRQINTRKVKIIYPVEVTKKAQHFCNFIHYLDSQKYALHRIKKTTIVFHNQSVKSNAYVSLAPKRMEVFLTPSQDQLPQPWLGHTAIHEYKHVAQVNRLNCGFTGISKHVFGEQIKGLVAGIVPLWVYEGDAVFSETAFSNAGRGRSPAFNREYRAICLDREKKYSFDQAAFGSYKHYLPNHYHLGYFMAAYGRKNYDEKLWDEAFIKTAKYPFSIAPIFFRLKKSHGISKKDLYKESYKKITDYWVKNDSTIRPGNYLAVNQKKKNQYTNYLSPLALNDSIVVAEKTGLGHITDFVLVNIRTGEEKALFQPGLKYNHHFSLANNRIYWAQKVPDARWDNKEFHDIFEFNIITGKSKRIIKKGRYFSPDISSDGSKIAAVRYDDSVQVFLQIIDVKTGKHIQSFRFNNAIQYPRWSADGKKIVFTEIKKAGKSIKTIHLKSREIKTIVKTGYTDIREPVFCKNKVIFIGAYSGIDNVYAVDTASKEIFQLTSVKSGVEDPSVIEKSSQLYFSNYTPEGFDIASIRLGTTGGIPLSETPISGVNVFFEEGDDVSESLQTDTIPRKEYPSKKYRKWLHPLNVHSWTPFYFNYSTRQITDPKVYPGLMLLSQNQLSTVTSSFAYAYINKRHRLINQVDIKAWYPVVSLSFGAGGQPTVHPGSIRDSLTFEKAEKVYFNSRVYLPIDLTRTKYIRYLEPSVQFLYNNAHVYTSQYTHERTGTVFLKYGLYFSRRLKKSHRDIVPKWAQTFRFGGLQAPFDTKNFGSLVFGEAGIYFPGLFAHHVVKLSGGYQHQFHERFSYSSQMSFPRGYYGSTTSLSKGSVDYIFPLFYPDLSLGPVLYMKRLRAAVFFDYGYNLKKLTNKPNGFKYRHKHMTTIGTDLIADVHLLRFTIPFDIGIRGMYHPIEKDYSIRPVFLLDLSEY